MQALLVSFFSNKKNTLKIVFNSLINRSMIVRTFRLKSAKVVSLLVKTTKFLTLEETIWKRTNKVLRTKKKSNILI